MQQNREETKGRFVKGRCWRMHPRSGFWNRGTSECTFVPVCFGTGEHPNVPSFQFLFLCRGTSAKTTLLLNPQQNSERPRSLLLSLGVPSRPTTGSYPGPVQVPSRVRGGPVQIHHVLCLTVFRTHPGPEVGAVPARPGPILLPSFPSRIGPGRAETDFLATSEK